MERASEFLVQATRNVVATFVESHLTSDGLRVSVRTRPHDQVLRVDAELLSP